MERFASFPGRVGVGTGQPDIITGEGNSLLKLICGCQKQVVVENRADSLTICQNGVDRVDKVNEERLIRLKGGVAFDLYADDLVCDAGREEQHPRSGFIIHSGARQAVRRRVSHAHGLAVRRQELHLEVSRDRSVVFLNDLSVANGKQRALRRIRRQLKRQAPSSTEASAKRENAAIGAEQSPQAVGAGVAELRQSLAVRRRGCRIRILNGETPMICRTERSRDQPTRRHGRGRGIIKGQRHPVNRRRSTRAEHQLARAALQSSQHDADGVWKIMAEIT